MAASVKPQHCGKNQIACAKEHAKQHTGDDDRLTEGQVFLHSGISQNKSGEAIRYEFITL
jgi:hypothetical protein